VGRELVTKEVDEGAASPALAFSASWKKNPVSATCLDACAMISVTWRIAGELPTAIPERRVWM
jgi:hypothetical protein